MTAASSAASAVRIEQETHLSATADAVAAFALTPAGVNAELLPLVRMTFPRSMRSLPITEAPTGTVVGHCWMLAGGVLPFDRHALGFASTASPTGEGHGFIETSSSWMQRSWRHERTIVDRPGGGCTVHDLVVAEPRVPGAGVVVGPIVRAVFRHRHRRLVRRWGAVPGTARAR
jgi:hypothetical protein